MDIVYPLGTGSVWENNELRFSLRSVEENLIGLGRVWVVGEKPSWLTGVEHIPMKDPTGVPWRNSLAKIREACKRAELSPEFLYMNDDFFLTQPVDIMKFPFIYKGNLPSGRRASRLLSLNRKESTTGLLVNMRLTTSDYDCHAPFRLEKGKVLALPVDDKTPGAFHWRSLYGNLYNVGGEKRDEVLLFPRRTLPDIKNYLSDKSYFAIASHAGKDWKVRQYITQRWPNKSKYELSTF